MTENKKKHLSVWIIWLVFHIYLLGFRFSLPALIVLGAGALILYLTTCWNERYEDGFMYQTMGNLLGTSMLVQLGWCVTENILPQIMIQTQPFHYLAVASWSRFQNMMSVITRGGLPLPAIGVAAVCYLLRLWAGKLPRTGMLASYAGNLILVCILLHKVYASSVLVLVYLMLTLVCVYVDLWPIAEDGKWYTNTKCWLNILTVLMVFVIAWDKNLLAPITRVDFLEYYFVQCATKWYHIVAATVALVAALVVHFEFAPGDVENWIDIKHVVASLCMVYLVLMLRLFHVGYWWLLLLINVLFILADALFIYPNLSSESGVCNWIWVQIGVAGGCAVLTFCGHFDIGFMAVGIVIGLFVGVICVAGILEELPEEYEMPGLFTTGIVAVLIPALFWLWKYARLGYHFILLIVLAVVCVALLWMFAYRITEYERENQILQMLPQILVATAFVLLTLMLCMTNGSKIRIELGEQEHYVVTVEAKREERRIDSVEYFWTDDWVDLESWKFQREEERELTSLNQIEGMEGKLRVVAKDQYGVTTERVFWVTRGSKIPEA